MKRNRCDNIGKNYLDFIPFKNKDIIYSSDGKGRVTIDIKNKGMFNMIAHKFFRRPGYTHIHLDDMGSFIWPFIDGKNTVYDIGLIVREHFGENAEPVYERLVLYMRTLENYGFIRKS